MTLQHTRRIVKSLFILFIIVVCIYLLPRVASMPLLPGQ